MKARIPAVLVLLALGAVYATSVRSYGMLMWDEAEYAALGRSVARGEGYAMAGKPHVHRPPLLPAIIAATITITGSTSDVVLRSLAILLSLLTLGMVGLAVERSVGPRWSAAVIAMLGAMQGFWIRTPLVMTDILFAGFFAAATWAFARACDHDRRLFWVSWTAFALAVLTRYTAILFGPVVLILLARRWRRVPWRSPHFWLAPLAAAMLLVPWLVRTHAITGDALAGFRMAAAQVPAYLPGVAHPWWLYGPMLAKMVTLVGIVTFIAGAILGFRRRDDFVIDSTCVVAFFVVYFSFYRYKEDRFILAVLPFVAAVAATLLRELRPRIAAIAVVAGVIVTAAIPSRVVLAQTTTLGHPSFLRAMAYLRARSRPGDVVMSPSVPQTIWYADRTVIPLDRSLNADWIVITNFERSQPKWAGTLEADVVFDDGMFRTGLIARRPSLAP